MADDSSSVGLADILAVDESIARSTGAAGYGLTDNGFVPKPFARLLAEKLALARTVFGTDIDLGSGSALRKILEISALEDARTWAALASFYDNQFVATARGEALSRLGEELGLPRPYQEARGTLKLTARLPQGVQTVSLHEGARLLTPGFHHVALGGTVVLSRESPVREVEVVAFYPGPEHNLDPRDPNQKIVRWNPDDDLLGKDPQSLFSLASSQTPSVPPEQLVAIEHTQPLTGGEATWPDERYRELLLRAPRSLWTADAIQVALSLVPGVRRVQVRERSGGLDVDLSLFGSFNFMERLFGTERDLASPYFFDVVVASTSAAIWDGPDGLAAAIESAMEDLRPIGIFPRIRPAEEVFVGLAANVVVKGLPLPRSSAGKGLNAAPAVVALKQRLLQRVKRYVDRLGFGEPVRYSEVMWEMMNEPGVTDVQELALLRFPAEVGSSATLQPPITQFSMGVPGKNVTVSATQIASFVESDELLRIL